MRANPVLVLALVLTLAFAAWWQRPWGDGPRGLFFNEALAAVGTGLYADGQNGFAVEVVARDLDRPWDLAFLGEHELLVTQKAGELLRIDLRSGQRQVVSGMPKIPVVGQGGLHQVVLHPQFATNGLIYLSHATPVDGQGHTTRLTRARLSGNALTEQTVLFTAQAATSKGQHFGGAIAFDGKGHVFLSIGDRGDRDEAQNLGRHNGKIVRLHDDGRVPDDNPFVKTADALPEIWSYGHRNPQGMGFDAAGQLWAVEHGPRGGDELNLVLPGRNYGWPVITYGKEYVGGSIGEGTAKDGMEQPVHYYVPSIGTGGMATYGAALFPQWKDSVFIASLKDNHLNRVQLRDGKFEREERLLRDQGLRLRAVRVSPKGEIWLTADQGQVLRLRAPVSGG